MNFIFCFNKLVHKCKDVLQILMWHIYTDDEIFCATAYQQRAQSSKLCVTHCCTCRASSTPFVPVWAARSFAFIFSFSLVNKTHRSHLFWAIIQPVETKPAVWKSYVSIIVDKVIILWCQLWRSYHRSFITSFPKNFKSWVQPFVSSYSLYLILTSRS